MPQGNSTPIANYDFSGVADRTRQMRAYDALPVTVRRALDAAPFEICCIATLDYYRDHGARETVREVRESARLFIEAARATTGSFPCLSSLTILSSSPRIPTATRYAWYSARGTVAIQKPPCA